MLLIALAVIVWLLPFGQEAVFDGHAELTVVISDIDQVDPDTLYFAPCWREDESHAAMQAGSSGDIPFRPGDTIKQNRFTIPIPYSGRLDAFSRVSSYHHPRILVIEYATTHANDARHRRRFPIPEGRGDREMLVILTEDAVD